MNAPSIGQILWSSEAGTQQAILVVLGLALVCAVTVYGPLIFSAVRYFLLERQLKSLVGDETSSSDIAPLDDIRVILLDSPLRDAYHEFDERWRASQVLEGIDRAPVRLMDILDERPLLAAGPRRSLLPILPGLFVATGVLVALTGLLPALTSISGNSMDDEMRAALIASQLGVALRATVWGFLCGIGAALTGRILEGAFEARSHGLDHALELAFSAISPGELAELTRKTQQDSLELLSRELTQFGHELNERLDRGLQRIEQSTARSASLVSQEQRGALHSVVQELSLSVRQGVDHHLSELRGALQRATEHQSSVTSSLSEAFDRMAETSKTQDRVAQTLVTSADSVEEAARSMRSSSVEMQPALDHLSATSRSLAETADRISDTQQVVSRTADGVRSSLELAAGSVDDQRQFIEVSLSEIRRSLVGLGDGLGESLQRSLREVDDVLGSTVGRLRDTINESNETIDRMAIPIRASEGATRETHLALDRVRDEVEALGQWMNQAMKPLRGSLTDLESRADDISRAMTDFSGQTRSVDKTMDALREEIHDESRRLQSTGGDLGRQLKAATDAIGMLENATSEAARRAQSETKPERNRPTARPAAPPLPTPPRRPAATASPGATTEQSPPPSPETPPAAPPRATPISARDDQPAAKSTSESDVAGSEYRMGAPRAQGPDPYARFEGREETPSNVRHFPTPERELGDGLRLSGLLGPRTPRDEAPPTANDARAEEESGTDADSSHDSEERD